jgi:hypothetical protein
VREPNTVGVRIGIAVLTREQLRHFADHGWILLEGVFDEEACRRYIDALDRARDTSFVHFTRDELIGFDYLAAYDNIFLEWYRQPGFLDANRQLAGAPIRSAGCEAHIRSPHRDRHTRPDELADPETWGWHRTMPPHWGTLPDASDPDLVTCSILNDIRTSPRSAQATAAPLSSTARTGWTASTRWFVSSATSSSSRRRQEACCS